MTDLSNNIKLVADDTSAALEKVTDKALDAGTAAAGELHEVAKKVDDKVGEVVEEATS